MRLWSVHPQYLDGKGLVALWREALGAQANLIAIREGRKIGYNNHPQLKRFLDTPNPTKYLGTYMATVWGESLERGYDFDRDKITVSIMSVDQRNKNLMPVTQGQLDYEQEHLLNKLAIRDPERWDELLGEPMKPHPSFTVIEGPIEPWEKVVQ